MKCQPEGFSQLEQDHLQCESCSGTAVGLSQEVEKKLDHRSMSDPYFCQSYASSTHVHSVILYYSLDR